MTHPDVVLFFILGCLVSVLVGYAVGRRIGMASGTKVATAKAALRMRQDLLTTGICPTCDSMRAEMVQYAKKG